MSDPVLELLKEKGISFTISGKDYVTKCFNSDHTDSNPSFRIDKVTGIGHCFSCGFSFNIFKHFGILTNNVSIRIAKIKEKLKALQISTNGLDELEGTVPFTRVFRGISAATLKHFGAFSTDKVEVMENRIVFPIKDVRDKIVCFVGRHTMSNGNPRYQNYPAGVTIPMFPVKFNARYSSMVIVEGLFDLLALYENGIYNVVCTFGTSGLQNNVSDKLLSYKVLGIEKIFIMYDGDEPGREAAIKIKPLIEEAGFNCEILSVPTDEDPGTMSIEDIKLIKRYINGNKD